MLNTAFVVETLSKKHVHYIYLKTILITN